MEKWNYDPNGNILTHWVDNNLHQYSYTISQNNQLHSLDGKQYEYDKIGNLVVEKGTKNKVIDWSVYGKLARIGQNTNQITDYGYDATGNKSYILDSKVDGTSFTTAHYVRDASGNVMAIYQNGSLQEQPMYGSSRLGIYQGQGTQGKRSIGFKEYEISNHLGNVIATVSDLRFTTALVSSQTDYRPFGQVLKERTWQSGEYSFGFNGQEQDKNIGTVHFRFREYEALIQRFWSVDPLAYDYPWNSPYAFAENRVIDGIDLEGLEWDYAADANGNTHIKVNVTLIITDDIIQKYSLNETSISLLKSTITNTFNEILIASTVGKFTGSVSFNGEYEQYTKQVIPTLDIGEGYLREDGLFQEGATTHKDASVSLNNRFGLKSLEQFGIDAVHELLHTLKLGHPFETTQTNDTKLILDETNHTAIDWYGTEQYGIHLKSTSYTDSNIGYNIMLYPMFTIDGKLLRTIWEEKLPKQLTIGQIHFMMKEIDLQKQGKGFGSFGVEGYFDYWEEEFPKIEKQEK